MARIRINWKQVVSIVCTGMILCGCYKPPPIPTIRTPIPVPLQDIFPKADELPKLQSRGKWDEPAPFDVQDEWDWSNAIAAMEDWNIYRSDVQLIYTIVQYGDSTGAEATWKELKDSSIDKKRVGEEVDI